MERYLLAWLVLGACFVGALQPNQDSSHDALQGANAGEITEIKPQGHWHLSSDLQQSSAAVNTTLSAGMNSSTAKMWTYDPDWKPPPCNGCSLMSCKFIKADCWDKNVLGTQTYLQLCPNASSSKITQIGPDCTSHCEQCENGDCCSGAKLALLQARAAREAATLLNLATTPPGANHTAPATIEAALPSFHAPDPPYILVLIASCRKYSHKMDRVRRTWAADLLAAGIPYLFVVGDPTTTAPSIDHDILTVNTPDTYEALPKKLLAAYAHVATWGTVGVFKADDDLYGLDAPMIRSTVEDHATQYFGCVDGYWPEFNRTWHFGKCSNPKINQSPYTYGTVCQWARGFAYFLPQAALQVLAHAAQQPVDPMQVYEDKFVAEILFNTSASWAVHNESEVCRGVHFAPPSNEVQGPSPQQGRQGWGKGGH